MSGKLSEALADIAQRLLKRPDDGATAPTTMATLLVAGAAWNEAIGDSFLRAKLRGLLDAIDWGPVTPWDEVRSDDIEALVRESVAYKRAGGRGIAGGA